MWRISFSILNYSREICEEPWSRLIQTYRWLPDTPPVHWCCRKFMKKNSKKWTPPPKIQPSTKRTADQTENIHHNVEESPGSALLSVEFILSWSPPSFFFFFFAMFLLNLQYLIIMLFIFTRDSTRFNVSYRVFVIHCSTRVQTEILPRPPYCSYFWKHTNHFTPNSLGRGFVTFLTK